MNTNLFLHKDNVNTLWDVISDEDVFKYLKRGDQEKISQMFVKNLKGFYDTERVKTNNIVDMNKKYILLILNYIKKNFSPNVPQKIQISYEELPTKDLITYEEIQNDRRSQFDRDYNRAQEEFTNAVTLKVPETPTFADNYKDEPIREMDKILKEMTAKRNYEVEQINRQYNSNGNETNWLKSQETSLKTEKFTPSPQPEENNYRKTKYINAEGELTPKKNVSWDKSIDSNKNLEQNNISLHIEDDEPDDNIFSKFKKVPAVAEPIHNKELNELKEEIKVLHSKLDKIMDLLSNGK